MRMIDSVRELGRIEKNAEKEYKRLMRKLRGREYSDLRVLLLRMALDTVLHKHLMEAVEKAYEEAIDLIEDFGYGELPETPEDAPSKQVSQDVVLIPGMPAIVMPSYGPLGSRIPPEDALRELLQRLPENVVVPEDGLNEVEEHLQEFLEMNEKMQKHYENVEKKAVHPILKAIARESIRNEEQHKAVLSRLLEKYGE